MIKKLEFIPHNEPVNPMSTNILFGDNLGKSVSSQKSIGLVNASRTFGQAKIGIHSNLSSGNLFIEDYAIAIDDAGLTLNISMVYNSQATPAGSQWRLYIGRSLVVNSTNVIAMTLDDGATIIFNSTDGVNFTAQTPSGNYFLVKNSDGTFNLTQPGTGDSALFNAAGFEQTRTNSVGATLQFIYDSANQITSIDLPSGRSIRYTYNQSQFDINLWGTDGSLQQKLMSYQLDAVGRIVQSNVPSNGANFYTSNYVYDMTSGMLQGIG